MLRSLVGSEMCIRDRSKRAGLGKIGGRGGGTVVGIYFALIFCFFFIEEKRKSPIGTKEGKPCFAAVFTTCLASLPRRLSFFFDKKETKNQGCVNSFFPALFEPLGSSKRMLKHYAAEHLAPFDEYPKDAHILGINEFPYLCVTSVNYLKKCFRVNNSTINNLAQSYISWTATCLLYTSPSPRDS